MSSLEYEIIEDYENHAMPLSLLAQKHDVSMAHCLKIVHYWKVERPRELMDAKKALHQLC